MTLFTPRPTTASIVGCRSAASAAMSLVPAPGFLTVTPSVELIASTSGVVAPTMPKL